MRPKRLIGNFDLGVDQFDRIMVEARAAKDKARA